MLCSASIEIMFLNIYSRIIVRIELFEFARHMGSDQLCLLSGGLSILRGLIMIAHDDRQWDN